jgi:KAP family P-loop domain
MLNLAGHLMLQQLPGRDNGRITTRLVLLAALHAGSISGGSPTAMALYHAWHRVGPRALDAAGAKYLRSFSTATGPAPPPVIIARQLAEALRLATGQAGGGAVGLFQIANAVIEQALADVQGRTFSRQVMDESGISPAALRDAFLEELAKAGITDLGSFKPDPNPSARDVYASLDNDKSVDRGDALRARAEAGALARIAALEDTAAPLAIGVFGDWGAGKTSFMDTIRKVIKDELETHAPYCERIVQINFNAWHFIETNLWASLVSHIFTELDRELRPAIGEALYGQLATARPRRG